MILSWLSNIVAWFVNIDPMVKAGRRAAAEAERYFKLDIIDPPEGSKHPRAPFWLKTILEIIHLAEWTWIKVYVGNTKDVKKAVQWCGMFAAACWRAAGIDPKWLATFWASTLRLDNWAKGEHWNGTPAGGPRPYIALNSTSKPEDCVFSDGSLPRAGDILVVGDETPQEGDHINIVMEYDPKTGIFVTISGNGGGVGPDGTRREGVVRANYKIGQPGRHPLRVYRPLLTDMKAAA